MFGAAIDDVINPAIRQAKFSGSGGTVFYL